MKKIKKLFLVAMLCLITLIVQTMTVAQATDQEATSDLIPEEEMKSYSVDLRALASNQEAQDILPFPITLRDFQADYVIFEPKKGDINVKTGLVEKELNQQTKKPVFTVEGLKHLAWMVENDGKLHGLTWDSAAGYDAAYNTAVDWYKKLDPNLKYEQVLKEIAGDLYKYVIYHANHLFEDVEGLNLKKQTSLTLEKKSDGMYKYSDSAFFPLDNQLFGNYVPLDHQLFENYNETHNYHFTLESHTQFYFNGERLVFEFTGDDDVWVFMDNKLVIDLGGVHMKASKTVEITSEGDVNVDGQTIFTLTPGHWYDFDFFFMERRTNESNLNITTNMEFNPSIEFTKIAYLKGEDGKDLELNSHPEVIVYPGQTIYYKFRIENIGNVPLNNITLTDDKLGLEVNSEGVFINDDRIKDYQITVGGKSVEDNPFGKLLSKDSAPNNTIEISSELFQYVVTDEDAESGKVINTATVVGTPENSVDSKEWYATEIVGVGSAPLSTPSLKLTKQVVDSGGRVIDPLNKDDLFTIQVHKVQDSGGEVFNVRLKAGQSVTLPVEYGVTYTIKEIVPMNYTLKDMSGDIKANYEVVVTTGKSDYDVVITNEVTNTKWFHFKQRVANFVAEVKSIVQPGEGS